MKLKIQNYNKEAIGDLSITGSKSESNRLLIIQALYPKIEIQNLSKSDDSQVTMEGLKSKENVIDVNHAGTAMRFLTAYFAIQPHREIVLTGSNRMQERPIKLLVEALNSLGADITYEKEPGFPPLIIKGKEITINRVSLPANISSQYISALMLVAPALKNGLKIDLIGETTSFPYIKMTQSIMDQLGFETAFDGNQISIKSASSINTNHWKVESDWSSASYFYSIVALADRSEITLKSFFEESKQGDAALTEIYEKFGVKTTHSNGKIILSKITDFNPPNFMTLNLKNTPDLAQTIAVTCLGLNINCKLSGLHTLKIKETDRLTALKTEIEKLGGNVKISDRSLELLNTGKINQNVLIDTYNDHRMAMAFAPLGLRVPININNPKVVSKSYPDFWDDLQKLGFNQNII
ncbi:MAG: 3-phosphoshikimate 1-carboxyvinyltransferase [Flavobacteriaceae bacterium]|nr:3-phosphoshikimate 1-carboxyvinyltransferase [Flavobacteriaceae bacterium]